MGTEEAVERITWRTVKNTVGERIPERSNGHNLTPMRRLRRRTKVLNLAMRRYSGIRSYSRYVKMKTSVLRHISDDSETDESGDYSDEEYAILHKSHLQKEESRTEEPRVLADLASEEELNVKSKIADTESVTTATMATNRKKPESRPRSLNLGWQDVKKKVNDARDERNNCSSESLSGLAEPKAKKPARTTKSVGASVLGAKARRNRPKQRFSERVNKSLSVLQNGSNDSDLEDEKPLLLRLSLYNDKGARKVNNNPPEGEQQSSDISARLSEPVNKSLSVLQNGSNDSNLEDEKPLLLRLSLYNDKRATKVNNNPPAGEQQSSCISAGKETKVNAIKRNLTEALDHAERTNENCDSSNEKENPNETTCTEERSVSPIHLSLVDSCPPFWDRSQPDHAPKAEPQTGTNHPKDSGIDDDSQEELSEDGKNETKLEATSNGVRDQEGGKSSQGPSNESILAESNVPAQETTMDETDVKNTEQETTVKDTEEEPDEKSTEQQPDEKSTEQQPDVTDTEEEPDEKSTEQQPDVTDTEEEPDEKSTEQQPDVTNTEEEPDIKNTAEESDVKSKEQEPSVKNTEPEDAKIEREAEDAGSVDTEASDPPEAKEEFQRPKPHPKVKCTEIVNQKYKIVPGDYHNNVSLYNNESLPLNDPIKSEDDSNLTERSFTLQLDSSVSQDEKEDSSSSEEEEEEEVSRMNETTFIDKNQILANSTAIPKEDESDSEDDTAQGAASINQGDSLVRREEEEEEEEEEEQEETLKPEETSTRTLNKEDSDTEEEEKPRSKFDNEDSSSSESSVQVKTENPEEDETPDSVVPVDRNSADAEQEVPVDESPVELDRGVARSDTEDTEDTLWMMETDENIDNSMSAFSKKRLQQLKRLNLIVGSESSSSEDEQVQQAPKFRKKRERRSSTLSDSDVQETKKLETHKRKCRPSCANPYLSDSDECEESPEKISSDESPEKTEQIRLPKSKQDANNDTDSPDSSPEKSRIINKRDHSNTFEVERTPLRGTLSSSTPKPVRRKRPENLQELIEEQDLIEEEDDPGFTYKDLGEDEIYLIDVPRTILETELVGKRIVLGEKKLKIGKRKFQVSRKNVDTVSCLFATGKYKRPYKIVNVNPVASMIAQSRLGSTSDHQEARNAEDDEETVRAKSSSRRKRRKSEREADSETNESKRHKFHRDTD